MNKLKKIVFSILLLVGNYVCSAQEISIRGGLNLSKAPIDLGETPTHGDSKFFPGLHVGPTIDFGINSLLSFETGLLYSTKGNKELHNRTVDKKRHSKCLINSNIYWHDIFITANLLKDFNGKAFTTD